MPFMVESGGRILTGMLSAANPGFDRRRSRSGSRAFVPYDRPVARGLLTLVTCGFWTIALGIACDSRQQHRPPPTSVVRVPPAAAAVPATVPARVAAIGYTAPLGLELRRAFDPAAFEPMPAPGPADWLAHHPEKPQSFEDYRRAEKNVPNRRRSVMYLLPVGAFPPAAPPLAPLAGIVHAFFMLEVKILPAVSLRDVTATTRMNADTNKRQLLAPEVLGWLTNRLPDDAFGLVAVTMEDLYPEPSWNFVFGMASLKARVGVQSFARQDPAFFGEPRPAGWRILARRRAAWTLLHEISHMFGLTHCTYWRCVVAGANHQDEADASPLHACPVCLRKLYSAIKFDPAAREDALAAEFGRLGIADEAAWSAARAAWIRSGLRTAR
jgi:archaemetzincin